MADFFFVVRTFVVTVVLFLAMQIRIGSRTIEQRSVAWVHSSLFVESLQNVSDGAVQVIHAASYKMTGLLAHLPVAKPGSDVRHNNFKHRIAKRAEGHRVAAAAESDGADQASAKKENEPQEGSFRSFFDVKTVHDADSK